MFNFAEINNWNKKFYRNNFIDYYEAEYVNVQQSRMFFLNYIVNKKAEKYMVKLQKVYDGWLGPDRRWRTW